MRRPPRSTPCTHRPRRPAAALLAVASLAAVLAGCSGANDSATVETSAEVGADEAVDGGSNGGFAADLDTEADAPEEDRGDSGSDSPAPTEAAVLAAAGRERIRTADITLEFEDPEAAVDEVTTAAEAHGGFVALADLMRDDTTGELGGTVTVRVPSDELLATLDALEDLAVDAPVRRIEEQDVGAQLTDIRAQVTNLTAYEEELRALLTDVREGTSDPDELLPVVERVQSVRSEIDRLRAQQVGLEDRVALSTITVTLTSTATEAPLVTTSWTPLRTVEEALAATGRALAGVADAFIWIVVTALPVTIVLAGPPLAVWWWLRRRRVTTSPGTGVPSAPPPPTA